MLRSISSAKYSVLVIISIVLNINILGGEISDKVDKILKQSFPGEISYKVKKFIIPSKIKYEIEKASQQRFFKDYVYEYRIFSGDSLIGIGLLDNVYGKAMPITFLVLFDVKGSIQNIYIVKYREEFGGEVSNNSWLEQFKGSNWKSSFQIGKDIDGISGATISVNSITKGIKKLTYIYYKILENE